MKFQRTTALRAMCRRANAQRSGATEVLERMKQLYKLEQDMRDEDLTWEQRTQRRQQEAVPVLNDIKKWMDEDVRKVLPKSPLGQAIAYALPR